jgi:glycosyltransferase involved in cell wall biosynthesis
MTDSQKHIVIDARNRRSSTGRYTNQLVEHLQALDRVNRYTVLVQPDDAWSLSGENFTTVTCRFKQFSFNPLDQITFSWQLYRLKPDLVHFTMTQQPMFYFGRVITTTHDLTMFEYARAGRLPGWIHAIRMVAYRFLVWWSHRKSKRIIVPTNYVAEDVAKFHPFTKDKLVVTYEASEHLSKTAAEPLPGARKPFIFHTGSTFPHKNVQRLVEAFALAKKQVPDLHLVLSGKKEYYFDQLEEWAKSSPVYDSILFPGFVTDAQMGWLFQNTECYVLPSLSEGFGIPGLEAMAQGAPLVSSNATCLPEVYGNAAVYFDPLDIDNMAAKIVQVVGNKQLQKELVEKGKKQVKKYSWSKMAKETLAVYTEVLSRP